MNDLIVVKFGGTSVRDMSHLRNAAKKIKQEVENGNRVVAVVSAQAGVTDSLIAQFEGAVKGQERTEAVMAERDAILAMGEQDNARLFSQVLSSEGLTSKTFYGEDMPLHVIGKHGSAVVDYVDTISLRNFMKDSNYEVPVVPGFQGINDDGNVVTIGRGGSDLTAVELAIALEAKRCDIYTDVDGVFTADPRTSPNAQKYENVSYKDMLAMARNGAKVLERTCVEKSMDSGVLLQVLSSKHDAPIGSALAGTIVSGDMTVLEHNERHAVPEHTTIVNVPGLDYSCV